MSSLRSTRSRDRIPIRSAHRGLQAIAFSRHAEIKKAKSQCLRFVVPGAGIEPARELPHWFLRPTRLPIPPSGLNRPQRYKRIMNNSYPHPYLNSRFTPFTGFRSATSQISTLKSIYPSIFSMFTSFSLKCLNLPRGMFFLVRLANMVRSRRITL